MSVWPPDLLIFCKMYPRAVDIDFVSRGCRAVDCLGDRGSSAIERNPTAGLAIS